MGKSFSVARLFPASNKLHIPSLPLWPVVVFKVIIKSWAKLQSLHISNTLVRDTRIKINKKKTKENNTKKKHIKCQ